MVLVLLMPIVCKKHTIVMGLSFYYENNKRSFFGLRITILFPLFLKIPIFAFRRVSIIRGRVVTMTGQGIIGVRVSVDRATNANNYGFTLTRPGGW